MRKHAGLLYQTILLVVVLAGVLYGMNYAFNHSPSFRSIFCGPAAQPAAVISKTAGSPSNPVLRGEIAGRISMFVFAAVTMLQFVALFAASAVIGRIRGAEGAPAVKLKQLENADIFLDVPLYIGLFGTVSSFLVMTFSPTSSRLIAYSSTLIGIIFSLALRLLLNYPLRKRLIAANNEDKK